ncbi:sugar transferase [Candidatus Gracilibacteria bacterium]|nr:sugar transferase [Candidatus Gracilibacteria bacterium]
MFELSTISIGFWQSVLKRIFDILFSSISLIILSPVFLMIYIGIKIEDFSGPAIYKNRRVGKNEKLFTLYKFRYMYWKDSVKDAYGQSREKDEALAYEESLKQTNNGRNGPLYKIQNDPRKMRFGAFIEKFSLDELPQLINVLKGDMSLIGPRPHQPREVELYSESDKQVLTIKPGISGMAQVYGRDKNSFQEEVAYDVYYIENYSFFLDLAILVRTVFVVLGRPFKR